MYAPGPVNTNICNCKNYNSNIYLKHWRMLYLELEINAKKIFKKFKFADLAFTDKNLFPI